MSLQQKNQTKNVQKLRFHQDQISLKWYATKAEMLLKLNCCHTEMGPTMKYDQKLNITRTEM